MKNESRKVVVIGAGISGLTCAYRLSRLGVDVVLIEPSDRVGGVIQSEKIDGYIIERGPNSSQGTEDLLALVDELGLTAHIAEGDPKAPAYVYFNGQLHPVPSSPSAFIKSKLLSLRGKLRIMREPLVPQRRSDEEESVAAFARRRIGREAAERMVAPFVSGIYAGDADELSVQAAFPRLANLETSYGGLFRGTFAKAREARREKKAASEVLDKAAPTRRRLISFDNGMAELTSSLADGLGEDLITGCSDIRLVKEPAEFPNAQPDKSKQESNFRIEFERNGSRHVIASEAVIIAAPAFAAAKLIAESCEELSRLLGEIYYPPLAIVCLSYDKAAIKTPLDGFGFLVAPVEGLNILGCVWNSSLFKGRAPAGKALLTVFIGGARNPKLAGQADAELVATAHDELQKILGISAEPHAVAITRYERSIPQYVIGHAARVKRIEALLEKIPGLYLIGNYLHGVSTGDCIKEADRVARKI